MADRRVRAIFEVQVTQAERGMKSLAGEVEKADKKVDALGKTLDGLGKKRTKVEIEADIQDAERRVSELEAHLDDLRAMDVTPEVRAETEQAKADLSEVKAELRDLYAESAEVQVTADTGGGFRIATQAANLALQLSSRIGTFSSTLYEERFQLWILDIIGRLTKTFLAVLAVLDQVVQYIDHVFVRVAHGKAPWQVIVIWIGAVFVPTWNDLKYSLISTA